MNKILLVCVILLQSAFAQKILTVNESVKIALNKNTDFQQSKTKLIAAESNVKAAYGSFMPTINGSLGWDWNKSDNENSALSNESRSYSAGVGANWLMFDGLSNYAEYDRNKNTLSAAKSSLNRQKQEIIFQVLSSYINVVNAKTLLKVKEDDLSWNQKNFEIISERNKLGAVTLADVYAQQVKLGTAELALIEAENSYETLRSNFLYYLGLDVLEAYEFEQPLIDKDENVAGIIVDKDYMALSDAVSKALQEREDIKSLQYSLSASNDAVRSAKAGYLPTLSSNLGLSTNAPGMGDLFKNKSYSAGLTLSVPIFSGWSTDTRVEAAVVGVKVQELELSDLNREVKRSLQKTYLDLQAAYKRVDVGRKNVKASLENRRIEEEKYSLGSTTLLNVLIANSEYTTALTNHINAQFEYRKLRDQLEYLTGTTDTKSFE
ncbi:MAG: TolC family protein [Ignavibacteriales bacterium]|nr:TolC family protein [Ignavibacteriales bacterium]